LCAGGACQAALTYCATVAGGFLIAAGIIEVADQVTNCHNNGQPANDACYADEEEDDEDPCEEWLDALLEFRISIVVKQAANPGADYGTLIALYRKDRAKFCANCPHLCTQAPPI
jgi:hypothetical protein